MHLTMIQTLVFAIVQGITELFPISSVAHGVFTPYVFHWNLSDTFLKQHFLAYVVMLHLGTALALFLYFIKDWVKIILNLFTGRDKNARKIILLVIVATIPAAIIGKLFQNPIEHVFSNVTSASIFLIINGFFLFFGERVRQNGSKEIEDLSFGQALFVGLFQSLALIPGFSRTGSTITAGFWTGLKHEASAKFTMLLGVPIIAGAAVLEVPKMMHAHVPGLMKMSLIGGLLAGICAFIATWIMMRLFKKNEVSAMRPFAYYCWIVGLVIFLTTVL